MRRLLPVLVAALCCAATPNAEAAKTTIKKSIWGPVEVDGKSQFPIYKDLGVGLYQYTLNWDYTTPKRPESPSNPLDPVYAWPEELDIALEEAARYDIAVSVAVIGAPGWANGGRDRSYAPDDATDFAQFMEAAERRYPKVNHWMVWVEPTKAANFQPLVDDKGKRLTGAEALAGPHKYAEMVDETYVGLKRLSKANKIIGGNTFTVGTVGPFRWIQALTLPNGRRPRMDLWGHNAFSARKPNLNAPPLGSGLADFSDLDQVAKWLDRFFPRKKLKIFISEFSLPTDHANYEFNFHVTRRTQAKWIRAALDITRSYGRVYTFGYLGLYDDPANEQGDQVERGLITRDGTRKPGYAAYRAG